MARRRIVKRAILAAISVLLVAGVAAPFVQVNRFGDRIRNALQQALQRRVEIGQVHFNLFTGPGFTVTQVTIHEDPSVGVEAFAYVESLEARVRLSTLWTGRLEFSRLRLDDTSVNLVKTANGWNIMPLLNRTSALHAGGGDAHVRLPEIQVTAGKLYFKFGDTKSSFYVTDADIDITPAWGEGGSFDLRFTGSPARSDRTGQGFGALAARGKWIASPGVESRLDMDVELQKSAMEEVARLFRSEGSGVHGLIASRAKISGPLSNLEIVGRTRIEDVHRWDLLPAKTGGLVFNYHGNIDWRSQKIEVEATPKQNPGSPIALRLRMFDYLTQPHWASDITIDQMPASTLLEVARHMGTSIPPKLLVDGKVMGVFGYSSTGGMQGQASIEKCDIRLTETSHLTIPRAELSMNGDLVQLAPAEVLGEDGQTAEIQGSYSVAIHSLDVRVKARAMNIAAVQVGSGHLLSAAGAPLLENFAKGKWSGWLRYQAEDNGPHLWTGIFDLRDAQVAVPGIVDPVRVAAASVVLEGSRVVVNRLRAHAGTLGLEGEYRYEPDAARPHRFKFSLPSVTGAELERLFKPALSREQSFLARTLRLSPASMPDWMKDRHAEGTIRIGLFTAGNVELRAVRMNAEWDAGDVRLSNVEARWEEGTVAGNLTADLSNQLPKYKGHMEVQNAAWRSGRVDLDGTLESAGLGSEFLLNLSSDGTFQARSIAVLPENPVRTASGSYEFSMSRGDPKLKLTSLQAALGSEKFLGHGGTQADGKLLVDLASSERVMHVAGPLSPLRLAVTTTPQ
jgi:hypothetical protein